ncbi:formate dehydrogenase subunit gamma [Roseateles sp.]|uniref:formate dehydrogenase subunit gamma n=1 Tax=Roseateles sp. TaxID=1971397 RepID=UPI00286BA5FC|nr:formate dehydrogenase subunit gamma [Roseateles sp.]
MRKLFVSLLMLLALPTLSMLSTAFAQAAPEQAASAVQSSLPPAGFVAPALPGADESNAQRARSQPGNNAPFWRGVHGSGDKAGISNLPGAEQGVLIQSMVQYPGSKLTTAGEAWRQVRNQWIIPYGGSLLLITVLALALFYFSKGKLGGHVPYTGRFIERFTYFERAAHWSNAAAFSLLAISGLVLAFGKFVLLPVFGATLYGWLAFALKNVHNFTGPLFAVSLLVVFMTFVRDNLPTAHDIKWLLKGGGLFGGHEVPSERFNAGEKVIFWGGVFGLGLVVVGSGLVLNQLIPGMAYLRGDMQIAHMIHAVASVLMMSLFLGHIYMGTLGMKDALGAMKTGMVDEGWAQEHHELWFDDIRAGKIPAVRTASTGAPSSSSKPAAQH